MKRLHSLWWLVLLVALAGCSGLKTYPNDSEKNLTVRTTLSGSLFTGVKAYLHVYDPKDDCTIKYVGSVTLHNGASEVGIPVNRPVCLDFVFHVTQIFSPEAHLHNRAIVTLRPGVRYVALLRYVDHVYSVSIRELGSPGKPGREVPLRQNKCPDLKVISGTEHIWEQLPDVDTLLG
jgi:hypothetical protein